VMGDSQPGFLLGDSAPDTLMREGDRRARTGETRLAGRPGRRPGVTDCALPRPLR
jgi:hypothetical protein